MTANTLSIDLIQPAAKEMPEGAASWAGIYRAGAAAALLVVLAGLVDMLIMFVPGTGFVPGERTVMDWFAAFQSQPLLALRDMGILNIVTTASTVVVFFALYGAHRRSRPAPAALALIILCTGTAIYIANNMALPMLSLSSQYAAAAGETQKADLLRAGQVLLAQEDIGAGSFIGFFIPELAGVLMSVVMVKGKIINRWAGWLGLVSECCMIVFNIIAAFMPGLFDLSMVFAMIGGPLALAWMVMTAVGLLRAGRIEAAALSQ